MKSIHCRVFCRTFIEYFDHSSQGTTPDSLAPEKLTCLVIRLILHQLTNYAGLF
jgi:hypothetical protein